MDGDPHARQRKDWRDAIAALHRQQRIARAKWQRAAPRPGPGMARKAAGPREEGTVDGDSIASD